MSSQSAQPRPSNEPAGAGLERAIELYAERQIDMAEACRQTGLEPACLCRELTRRDLSVLAYPDPQPWRLRRAG